MLVIVLVNEQNIKTELVYLINSAKENAMSSAPPLPVWHSNIQSLECGARLSKICYHSQSDQFNIVFILGVHKNCCQMDPLHN